MNNASSSSTANLTGAAPNVDDEFIVTTAARAQDLNTCLQLLWDSVDNDLFELISISIAKVLCGVTCEAKQQEQIHHFMEKWRALPDADKSGFTYIPSAWPPDMATMVSTILDKGHNKDSISVLFQWIYGTQHIPSSKATMIEQLVKDKMWPLTHTMLRNILSHQHFTVIQHSVATTVVPPLRVFSGPPLAVSSPKTPLVIPVPLFSPAVPGPAAAFTRVVTPKPLIGAPAPVSMHLMFVMYNAP
jgi:hypothetical protein